MIISAVQYSYINSKIHSLKSRLLKPLEYKNLLQSKYLNDFIEALRSTAYREGLNEGNSYDELIHLYYVNLFHQYIKLIHALSGNIRCLVNHLYQRYELENIKLALRCICNAESREKAVKLFFPLIKNFSISMDILLESTDLFDFIQKLKGTTYYDPLDNSYYRFQREGKIFPLEMALDLAYYEELWRIVTSFKLKDKKIAKFLIGLQLDAINLLWIIRFKEIYHFTPEEILNYSLIHGCFISNKIRKKLAYSIDYNDVISNLKDTPYRALLNGIDDPEVAYTMLLKNIYKIVKKNWTSDPFQIGIILEYIFFMDMEIRNLITITEAMRGEYPNEKINKYLVNTI